MTTLHWREQYGRTWCQVLRLLAEYGADLSQTFTTESGVMRSAVAVVRDILSHFSTTHAWELEVSLTSTGGVYFAQTSSGRHAGVAANKTF